MELQLGTNVITWSIIFPILIIVAAGIVWLVIKTKVTPWKRVGAVLVGLFAFIGFTMALLGFYYHVNSTFAESYNLYSYSTLAPKGNPFESSSGYTGKMLMIREVQKKDGQVNILLHPNPAVPTEVALFTSGEYIQAQLKDNIVTIPPDTSNSLPRVIKTSLWWALTKDLSRVNQTVK